MVYERIIPHFPRLSKFTLKINSDFLYVPISEVASQYSPMFHGIIIKIFQKFVVNISKMFPTFLSKHFFNLSKISWMVMLFGTSIDDLEMANWKRYIDQLGLVKSKLLIKDRTKFEYLQRILIKDRTKFKFIDRKSYTTTRC